MPVDIVVVGSCNLDLVVNVEHIPQVGQTVLGGDLQRIPGGKGANQAVAAARLEKSVAIVGRIGDDESGSLLQKNLEDNDVNIDYLFSSTGVPTGVALIAVQGDGDNTIVVSPGANSKLTPEDVIAAPPIAEAQVVLLQAEIPIETVLAAAEIAKGIVIWNPAPAPNEIVPLELLDLVDVLIPNKKELELLAGTKNATNLDSIVEMVQTFPCSSTIVTLGEQGAVVVASNEAVHIPAPDITPVDTTAAGDSFCAAIAASLVEGKDLIKAAQWAVQVGSATTLVAGAQPSLPTPKEVHQRLKDR
ncbi:MAG: ribokinase [Acidimicrobiaceae bacterium]|nr:ribokinase [Acidimicrobiaceae bacterium]